jgi:hypothetical protein
MHVTVELVLLHGNVCCVIKVNVIQIIGANVFQRWEQCLHVTSTAHLNAGHPWTVQISANADVITAVMK